MALTTVSRIKAFLGVADSDTSRDLQYQALLSAADALIKHYCNRDFESQTYTEYLSGNNQYAITLRQRPVTSITSVHLDATGNFSHNPSDPAPFGTETALTYGLDCVLDYDRGSTVSSSGVLYRINYVWPVQPQAYTFGRMVREVGPLRGNIKVVYVAGYTTIPEDLQYACCYLASFMRRTVGLGGELKSERIGDYSYELMDVSRGFVVNQPELGAVRQILSKYRESAI